VADEEESAHGDGCGRAGLEALIERSVDDEISSGVVALATVEVLLKLTPVVFLHVREEWSTALLRCEMSCRNSVLKGVCPTHFACVTGESRSAAATRMRTGNSL